MGDWRKNGNWAPPMLIMAFGILVAILFSRAYSFAYFCPSSEAGNLTICAREWLSAAGGYFATIIAAVTVYFLWRQIRQTDEHRRANLQREAQSTADILLIDLLETCRRIRGLGVHDDLDPPVAEISRRMIPDAIKVTPILAMALQKHCAEVAQFSNTARTSVRFLPQFSVDQRNIAFRAHVLSWCFGVASRQIEVNGEANGPFITASVLAEVELKYGADAKKREYLDLVFNASGIG